MDIIWPDLQGFGGWACPLAWMIREVSGGGRGGGSFNLGPSGGGMWVLYTYHCQVEG